MESPVALHRRCPLRALDEAVVRQPVQEVRLADAFVADDDQFVEVVKTLIRVVQYRRDKGPLWPDGQHRGEPGFAGTDPEQFFLRRLLAECRILLLHVLLVRAVLKFELGHFLHFYFFSTN